MRGAKFWLGVVLSIAWLGVAFYIAKHSDIPTKANEWGDYLAGMCAPLAFLWLVLGYMQQGDELRAQAEELRQSVIHQSELARASSAQLELQRNEVEASARAAWRASLPRLQVTVLSMEHSASHSVLHLHIVNRGGFVRGLRFTVNEPVRSIAPEHLALMNPEEGINFRLSLTPNTAAPFEIRAACITVQGEAVEMAAILLPKAAFGTDWWDCVFTQEEVRPPGAS